MTEQNGRVAGKVAIVSGGSRGMGASHVRTLVAEGAKAVIADVLDDNGKALAAELGENAIFVHLDVTDPEQWTAAVQAAVEAFGTVDILVNNAGIANGAPLESFPTDAWQKILDINLSGVFYGMRAVVPVMKQHSSGSIVNVSSVEGLRGSVGLHGYVASKFGVRGITKSAALELGPAGIRVNSIHPGLIETPMTTNISAESLQIALGRAAQPAEVSKLVLFLASDESSYSTGAEFVIDGGLVAGVPHN
ncbi:glucose 1-dehydrogenase [Humibacter ginsenosidimutans]|uniref:Glucose 1-dehydrogenase n=1 Tax=Humibacter ginsenosidimutans TaxID=2599293 RepID=A0A5B8M9H1_9MICO|nr:glucose 1-dehydrogenase [Humibacter ginsenosidimutans]QDZ16315.1 glucose 1-dehydrogenase [Humibacter ginsenosidimutans]